MHNREYIYKLRQRRKGDSQFLACVIIYIYIYIYTELTKKWVINEIFLQNNPLGVRHIFQWVFLWTKPLWNSPCHMAWRYIIVFLLMSSTSSNLKCTCTILCFSKRYFVEKYQDDYSKATWIVTVTASILFFFFLYLLIKCAHVFI